MGQEGMMSRLVAEYIDLTAPIVWLGNTELSSPLSEDKVGERSMVPVNTVIFGDEQDSM